jgi:hypothetical protein
MSGKAAPKQFSAYIIVSSDDPSMPVDSILIEKGALVVRDWTVMDFTTGESTGAVGQRIARLCPDCRVQHKSVGILGHDGDCGSEAAKSEGVAELRHAKKRVTA